MLNLHLLIKMFTISSHNIPGSISSPTNALIHHMTNNIWHVKNKPYLVRIVRKPIGYDLNEFVVAGYNHLTGHGWSTQGKFVSESAIELISIQNGLLSANLEDYNTIRFANGVEWFRIPRKCGTKVYAKKPNQESLSTK